MHDLTTAGLKFVFHPQYASVIEGLTRSLAPYDLHDHFIIFSSGTTTKGLKGYALSREALFKNAEAVNTHFGLNTSDVWGLSLPEYHVGGLSIFFRAHLLGSSPVDLRPWEPVAWKERIIHHAVTVTTVVPTQVFDLASLKLTAPPTLKLLIVGGDFLSSELEKEALNLGWPIIRTFGMTEVCSQLASARMGTKDLDVLPIHQIKIDEGRLKVKSEALFTLEFKQDESFQVTLAEDLCDSDGFYVTNDRAELSGTHLRHLGRFDDQVKISGHLVNVLALKDVISTYALKAQIYGHVEVALESDSRKGKKVVLSVLDTVPSDHVRSLSELIRPVAFDEVRTVKSFERTDLGKLKKT